VITAQGYFDGFGGMPFALGEHRGRARVDAKILWIRCTFYRAGILELERIRTVSLAVRHHCRHIHHALHSALSGGERAREEKRLTRVEGAIVAGGIGIQRAPCQRVELTAVWRC